MSSHTCDPIGGFCDPLSAAYSQGRRKGWLIREYCILSCRHYFTSVCSICSQYRSFQIRVCFSSVD